MENIMRFDVTPYDICSSTVAKLIHSSADAGRVVDLVRERFADGSHKLVEAIKKLGWLLSSWDTQGPVRGPSREPSYWLAVADQCNDVCNEMREQRTFWVDEYKTELLLDALAQAAISRLGNPIDTNPEIREKQP